MFTFKKLVKYSKPIPLNQLIHLLLDTWINSSKPELKLPLGYEMIMDIVVRQRM